MEQPTQIHLNHFDALFIALLIPLSAAAIIIIIIIIIMMIAIEVVFILRHSMPLTLAKLAAADLHFASYTFQSFSSASSSSSSSRHGVCSCVNFILADIRMGRQKLGMIAVKLAVVKMASTTITTATTTATS